MHRVISDQPLPTNTAQDQTGKTPNFPSHFTRPVAHRGCASPPPSPAPLLRAFLNFNYSPLSSSPLGRSLRSREARQIDLFLVILKHEVKESKGSRENGKQVILGRHGGSNYRERFHQVVSSFSSFFFIAVCL